MDKLDITIHEPQRLHVDLAEQQTFNVEIVTPDPGTRNYEKLKNLPEINGIQLVGSKTLQDLSIVSENTTEGWASDPEYIPKYGELCVYLDYYQVDDGAGNTTYKPALKIGDGSAYIADLPFVVDSVQQAADHNVLTGHIADTTSHVTQAEKDMWSSKLNYAVVGEELVFTRL